MLPSRNYGGSFNVAIGTDADVSLRVDGGSGRLTIAMSEDAAVRVDVRDDGSGRVPLPLRFERTRSGDVREPQSNEDDEGNVVITVEHNNKT